MTDKDKQESEDPSDSFLRKVLELTERLRNVQTAVDALLAAAQGHFQELRENRDEIPDATTTLRRLESLLNQAQEKAGEALVLSGDIVNTVDQGIGVPCQEAE